MDRGRMTRAESRVRVKRWSMYQGCGASGPPGSRKSHTGRKEGRSYRKPCVALGHC